MVAKGQCRRNMYSSGLSFRQQAGSYTVGGAAPANQPPITNRISAANSRTRASSVSHEHMNRAPPLPMKV